jgi:hypothetical protein
MHEEGEDHKADHRAFAIAPATRHHREPFAPRQSDLVAGKPA